MTEMNELNFAMDVVVIAIIDVQILWTQDLVKDQIVIDNGPSGQI